MENKRKSLKITLNIFEWVFIVAFALLAIFCLLFSTQNVSSKSSGNIFGYETRLVVSGSMEGDEEFYKGKNFQVGKIKTGSMIFIKSIPSNTKSDDYKLFVNDIKVGDVLTFTPVHITTDISVTHRVIKIETINNNLTFTTKGDAPSITETETFPVNNIIGKVTKASYTLGTMYTNFFSNKPLIATIILVPTVAIIGGEVYKIVKIVKEDKAKKALATSETTSNENDDKKKKNKEEESE